MSKGTILYLYHKLSSSGMETSLKGLGGAQKKMVELADFFNKNGYRSIIASDDKRESIVTSELSSRGIEHIRLRSYNKNVTNILKSIYKLKTILSAKNIALIHSHSRWTTLLSSKVARLMSTPFIHTEHNVFSDKTFFRYFIGENVTAVSKAVKRNIIDLYGINGSNVDVIYNGIQIRCPDKKEVDDVKCRFQDNPKQKLISVVAGISKQKGHEYLIHSIPKVLEQYQNAKYLILGGEKINEKGLKQALINLTKNYHIQDKVLFLGHQNNVEKFIKASVFTILPSLHEGLPGAVIEANMLGKAVIATDVGGANEIIKDGENGYLIEPKNINQLSNRIIRLLTNEEAAYQMGQIGKKKVNIKFSMNSMYTNYHSYYKKKIFHFKH